MMSVRSEWCVVGPAGPPQQPDWPDPVALAKVRHELLALPALVSALSVRRLRHALSRVALGKALLLQGGDCAEAFGTGPESVRATLGLLGQVAGVLGGAGAVPVLQVGRLAGQYAKPRSMPVELVGTQALPSFRGHIVHDDAPDAAARTPDPYRLLRAYHEAAGTLRTVAGSVAEGGADVWVSHEALLLDYELSLLRPDAAGGRYGGSGHLLWLGERTRDPDGAHAELLAGLGNPVACKLGPTATVAEVLALCSRLDPHRAPGRLTLITRMGAAVQEALPPLVRAVQGAGHPVVWLCDPMHGNTVLDPSGAKTRQLSAIAHEVLAFVRVHRAAGSWPGGLHLELTGDDVDECVAGPGSALVPGRSTSLCDPRLNARQALQLAHATHRALAGPQQVSAAVRGGSPSL